MKKRGFIFGELLGMIVGVMGVTGAIGFIQGALKLRSENKKLYRVIKQQTKAIEDYEEMREVASEISLQEIIVIISENPELNFNQAYEEALKRKLEELNQ